METATATKHCVKCNKDVTHAQRMKDAKGAYWCMDCGSQDSQSKHSTNRVVCADCRSKVGPEHIKVVDGENVCDACVAARAAKAASGRSASSGDGKAAKIMKLAAGIITIGIGATLISLYFLGIIG